MENKGNRKRRLRKAVSIRRNEEQREGEESTEFDKEEEENESSVYEGG
jgi:hypothetical protein